MHDTIWGFTHFFFDKKQSTNKYVAFWKYKAKERKKENFQINFQHRNWISRIHDHTLGRVSWCVCVCVWLRCASGKHYDHGAGYTHTSLEILRVSERERERAGKGMQTMTHNWLPVFVARIVKSNICPLALFYDTGESYKSMIKGMTHGFNKEKKT